jgi:hypothetical protein
LRMIHWSLKRKAGHIFLQGKQLGNYLNFNFHKSVMVRISVESGWLINAVGVLTCKLRNMSFKYLVFLLGQFIGGCRLRNLLLLILWGISSRLGVLIRYWWEVTLCCLNLS